MKEEILKQLKELADDKYQKFHSNLCPTIDNILGVRVPKLRVLAKEIVKSGNGIEYLVESPGKYYEEVLLQGFIIGLEKMNFKDKIKYLKKFIPKIDNWATCDMTCSSLKFTKDNMEEMWNFLLKYVKSNKEFEIRFAVVMMLDYYLEDEYIDDVLNYMNTIKNNGYYAKMAVAWLISMAYVQYPKKTLHLLQKNNLDDFTYNKALQKAIESYKISDEDKNMLRNMKR